MDSVKKFVGTHPILMSAGVSVLLIWAYHGGYLNALLTSEGKMKLPASSAESPS